MQANCALAYDQEMHKTLSDAAVTKSVLVSDFSVFDGVGLASIEVQVFRVSPSESLRARELIVRGADLEDVPFPRSRHHFFDVQHGGRGLHAIWPFVGEPSPDFILESAPQYSYASAVDHFRDALAGATQQERELSWAALFETLGHVIHHIQDMAQPEHVRNDVHVNLSESEDLFGEGWFELYSNRFEGRSKWQPLLAQAGPPVRMARARHFWSAPPGTLPLGMADFTSRNFVSKDTNFAYRGGAAVADPIFPLPPAPDLDAPGVTNKVPLTDPRLGLANAKVLCDALRSDPNINGTAEEPCELEFVALPIRGHDGAEPAINTEAVSLSLFDQYLRGFGRAYSHATPDYEGYTVVDRLFTLNKYNFNSAFKYLIPRAVTYSAGLIDHFFRGRLEFVTSEANGDRVTVYFRNVSPAGEAFGSGQFHLYYESADGTRKELPIISGATLSAGQLARGGTHGITATVAEDLDLLKSKAFAVSFKGTIGEEEAAAAVAFDVPGLYHGFTFTPNQPIGETTGSRLIFRRNGQWVLHPQTGFAAQSVDWKGQYENGRPTRILSWAGTRYADSGLYSYQINQDGKPFVVAPYLVLGAAIQKDAEGIEWVIAICWIGSQDIVLKRRAIASSSPDGWQQVGQPFTNPSNLEAHRRPWLFNGAGTEAQTMRELKRDPANPKVRRDLTRLKATIHGDTVAIVDLGNTVPTERRQLTTVANCESPHAGSLTEDWASTIAGETVVAVDYVDGQEITARVIVDSVSTTTLSAAGSPEGWSGSRSGSEKTLWTLELGSATYLLYRREANGHSDFSRDGFLKSTENQVQVDSASVVLMDLRSGTVMRRLAHHEGDVTETRNYYDVTSDATISSHNDYSVGSEDLWRLDFTTRNEHSEGVDYGYPGEQCAAKSDQDYAVPYRNVSHETFPKLLITTGSMQASFATDIDGNLLLSLSARDAFTSETRRLNRLTNGSLDGLLQVDASTLQLSNVAAQ